MYTAASLTNSQRRLRLIEHEARIKEIMRETGACRDGNIVVNNQRWRARQCRIQFRCDENIKGSLPGHSACADRRSIRRKQSIEPIRRFTARCDVSERRAGNYSTVI